MPLYAAAVWFRFWSIAVRRRPRLGRQCRRRLGERRRIGQTEAIEKKNKGGRWPATVAPVRAVAGVQVRLATQTTSDIYVADKLWRFATLAYCPWHRDGGCGFCRHGTYERVRPPGTLIARWYCPAARRTVSALPDCLASHYSGTLVQLEAMVSAVEQAHSLGAAAEHLRTEIELPGALRYLSRLCRAIHSALASVRGFDPKRFAAVAPTVQDFAAVLGTDSVLIRLRDQASVFLPQLLTPLGFNPLRHNAGTAVRRSQHRMGRDPPQAIVEPPRRTGHRPDKQE